MSLHSIYTIFLIYYIYFYIIRRIFWYVCWIILSVSRFYLRGGLWDFIEIILIAAGLNKIPVIYQLAELVIERGTWHTHVPFQGQRRKCQHKIVGV